MRRASMLIVATVAIAALGAWAVACGGGSSESAPDGAPADGNAPAATTVDVTVKDFAIALDRESVPAGQVTFNVANAGAIVHEFVVFKTDLAPAGLTMQGDTADEEGAGLDHIDEIEDVATGETKSLTMDLAPGHYVFICNLPGHYEMGMRTAFTVS